MQVYGIDLALAYQVSVSVALAVCYPIAEQSLRQVGKNELSRKLCTHLRNAGTRGNALVLASRQRKCKKGTIKIAAVVYVTAPLVRLDSSLHKIRPSFRPQSRSVQGNLMPTSMHGVTPTGMPLLRYMSGIGSSIPAGGCGVSGYWRIYLVLRSTL